MPVAGLMVEHLGWESVFYVFGAAGLVWFFFWWIIVKDKPEEDPHISEAELEYIMRSLGASKTEEVSSFRTDYTEGNITIFMVTLDFTENQTSMEIYAYIPTCLGHYCSPL